MMFIVMCSRTVEMLTIRIFRCTPTVFRTRHLLRAWSLTLGRLCSMSSTSVIQGRLVEMGIVDHSDGRAIQLVARRHAKGTSQ